MLRRIKSYFGLIVILLLSYWTIAPLLIPGFFPMHDDTQVARVQQMAKAISDGMFPVRWVPDLGYGYGYPIFTFYGPLAYYIGVLFMFIGADALIATKLMIITGILLSGIGMYYLARIFWGSYGAVIAALLYVYAPYHAVNIYVRGAVGELFGYAWIPFVFYALIKAHREEKFRYTVIAAVSYAALITSHNLTGLMVTPFVIVVLLFLTVFSPSSNKKARYYFLQFGVVLGLLISAFYWVPALLEMDYTNVISQVGGAADFREHFICLSQLWESQWGFGGSARGCIDGLSFRLGKIHILLSIASILIFLLTLRKKSQELAIAVAVGVIFLLTSLFLSLDYAKPLWKAVPVFSFIQYPWRFLILMSFFSSFLGGAVVWYIVNLPFVKTKQFIQTLFALTVSVGIVFFYARTFSPQIVFPRSASDYTSIIALRWYTSRISDEYLPKGFSKPYSSQDVSRETFSVVSGRAVIGKTGEKTQKKSAVIEGQTASTVHVSLAYFPAWKAYIDGKETPIDIEKNGMSVVIPKGEHTLIFEYKSTDIEKIANTSSLIGIIGLVAGIIFFTRKRIF